MLATISDIPTELILYIAAFAEPDSLLQLALTCRSLHFSGLIDEYLAICIPGSHLYDNFQRGILQVPAIWDEERNRSPAAPFLKGLRVSLSIRSLKTIVWEFMTAQSEIPLVWQFRHLSRLLAKLDTVEDITLDFRKVWFFGIRSPQADPASWAKALLNIFEMLATKNCVSIAIYYAEFNNRRMGGESTSPERPVWVEVAEVAYAIISSLLPVARLASFFPFAKPYRRSLADHTYPELSHSPLTKQAVTLLNGSSISTLKIESPYLPRRQWMSILACVEVPHLRELVLNTSGPEFPFVDLLHALYRHPKIEVLELQVTFPKLHDTNFRTCLPSDALPALRHITAPEPFLQYILSHTPILERVQNVTMFFFPLLDNDLDKLGCSLVPMSESLCQKELDLKLHVNSAFVSQKHIDKCLANAYGGHPDWIKRCSSIEIITSHYGWDSQALNNIPEWLSWFNPHLRRVIVRHRIHNGANDLAGRSRTEADARVVEFIKERCPQVEEVSVVDERSSVPEIKDMNPLCAPYIHKL